MTIPKEYIQQKGWKKGEVLIIGFDSNGNIIIKDLKK